MLEKIGLPAKPSLRTNNWVVDASHCQSCSSQFTFLNRKHHCRRCGGIFCNACTQHRMVLRGQGESPVRVCDACKNLEEATRFELRHGHKGHAGKGSSKTASRSVDEVLNQVLADDGKMDGKDITSQVEGAGLLGIENFDVGVSEMDSITPDQLRQQALDEKNNYRILKGEGKSADALKAFKRSKELERQAAALDLQMRKNRRKALASSSIAETQSKDDISSENGSRREKSVPQKGKEKDDLTAELRELGWSDMDAHDSDSKPATMSLEGELLNLIGHESGKTSSKASSGIDKSEVIALKKKALGLKREGRLAEAKEELKRAKILEKQLEEQEFLAEADDSDDELSALIRSIDNDDQKGLSGGFNLDAGLDLSNFSGFGGDLAFDGNFEVTDDDLHDPEMAAALQSLGWDEETTQHDSAVLGSASVDREALQAEIMKLKREAVNQKRSGNMAEAMSLLKKAKILEKDFEKLDVHATVSDTDVSWSAPKASEISEQGHRIPNNSKTDRKSAPKSRLMIQKELLAIKKKALALRREGKLEEADDELKKAKILEQQLEEMDNSVKVSTQMNDSYGVSESITTDLDFSSLAPADEEGDLTEQDLSDPTYLSVLQNLGWQDEDVEKPSAEVSNQTVEANVDSTDVSPASVKVVKRRRNKGEIQRELLGLKRKALALRRQGQEAEAEEVLAAATTLEEELAEIDAPKHPPLADITETKIESEPKKQEILPERSEPMETESNQTPLKRPAEVNDASEKRQVMRVGAPDADLSPSVSPENQRSPIQQEILAHKRKAVAFKREGKLAEARDELRKAKLLERNLEEDKPENSPVAVSMEVTYSTVSSTVRSEHSPSTSTNSSDKSPPAKKPMKDQDRFKLQRECLSHKRNALKLRREGRSEEADAELELAKKLEAQLEEATPQSSNPPNSVGESLDDAGVEDLFDPQLLSALKSIGLHDTPVVSHTPVKPELSVSSSSKNDGSSQEKLQLEAQIKAEKMTALNLKRAGKQKQALDALRRAKQMEKKLSSLPS